MLILPFMVKTTKCRLSARFSYDQKSLVSVSHRTQNFKTKFFIFSFMEKMLVKHFIAGKKCNIQFHRTKKNAYFAIFMRLLLLYEIV